jgi:hypothetical protein
MKKKSIILIVVGILLVLGAYFGYKGFNLYYYNINNITTENYQKFIDGLKITNNITINSEKLNDSQYLTFKNIKVKNEFSNFQKLDNQYSEDTIKYVLYDENDKIKASFWMSTTSSYVDIFKTNKTLFGTEDERITNTDLSDFLEKNNINDDIELFQYLEKNKDVKNNIFTSVKQMKENYTIQFMASVVMPKIEGITLIDGDYKGYILNVSEDIKEVSILKNNERYVFLFLKLDYFTDEYIQKFLNTIVID